MKKTVLLLLCIITLNSCSLDDEGSTIRSILAEISANDLPEYFEKGETYEVEVSYLLPDLCHQPLGLQLNRGADFGDARRDIYVSGVVSYDVELTECPSEPEDDSELVIDTKFTILIDEEEPYTFYFWTGTDSTGENIFETVEVPVLAPGEVPSE